jgi:hypothetical protein
MILCQDVLLEILDRLPSTGDRIRFLWALGRVYKPWLEFEVRGVVERIIQQGASIGWVYRAHFAPLIKAKRIAKKWKDPRYCQGCGRRSESSQWLHFTSKQTGRRLCTQCIKKEWDAHLCECGIPVTFKPDHSNGTLFGFFPPTAWNAVCARRKQFLRPVPVEEALRALETGTIETGCAFDQRITEGFFLSPNMIRQAEEQKRKRETRLSSARKKRKKLDARRRAVIYEYIM